MIRYKKTPSHRIFFHIRDFGIIVGIAQVSHLGDFRAGVFLYAGSLAWLTGTLNGQVKISTMKKGPIGF